MSDPAPPLVLASGSPRRVELLGSLGLRFAVLPSGVGEEVEDESDPGAMTVHLAERKARAVAAGLAVGLVLGADTTVSLDGLVLNKPADAADAERMLRLLRGRAHHVWTGIALLDAASSRLLTTRVRSVVHLRRYTDAEIAAYVATGEPLDKAGAYAIQGGAGVFVERIEGCYTNVVGLPLCSLGAMLTAAGLPPSVPGPICRLPDGSPCPRLG